MKDNILILKRLYRNYTSKYIKKILIGFILSMFVAGSTSVIAYLLDPAIKKIFIEKDQTLIFLIPLCIILAFATKGISLYFARMIMIGVGEDVRADVQKDMLKSLLKADTNYLEKKHTGKFISNLTLDTSMITNLISTAVLNAFKDSLTLIGLLAVMFYQNWKLSILAITMIPLATFAAKRLAKRIAKLSEQVMDKSGIFNTHLVEIFKNHKLIKTFQAEKYERE